ncbi:MAG TPA: MFS transporter [Bacteroidia bacterium]|nr:MFS transporter [Bacteroidia bacterium]
MQKLTRSEISLLLTLALIQFTLILDGMIMMPMAPNLKDTMHITSQQFGFLVSSYGFAAFFSAIFATFWIDRFDRKNVLLFLYAGFIVGTAGCALAPGYGFFLGMRIFTGLFGGIAGAVILSIIGDVISLEKRGRAMGILMSGFSMAAVIGVPIGIVLSENYNWHVPFYMICAIGILIFAGIWITVPKATSHIQNVSAERETLFKKVFTNKNQVRALAFSLCLVIAHFGIIPFISDYQVNNNGFDMKTEVIYIYVVGGLLTVITSPVIGKLADRYGRIKVFTVLNFLSVIPILLISHFNSDSLAALLGASALFFIFSGARMVPASAMITSAVEPAWRGGFMSLNSAIQQLGVAVTTIIGGLIITNDAEGKLHNYNIVGYIAVAATVVVYFLGRGVLVAPGQKHDL